MQMSQKLTGADHDREFDASLAGFEQDTSKSEADVARNSSLGLPADPTGKRPPWAGKMMGRFRLMRLLGEGGMGRVIQAQDVNLQRVVALKIMNRRILDATENQRVEQFLREARAAATIDHPNVVQIYEINSFKGWWYIAMELLEGGSLLDVIKAAGPMAPARACSVIADAAAALSAAHETGIIHRDIKPANLMLTRTGRCKVADFGLMRFDDPNDPFHLANRAVGTPLYAAPEVIKRQTAAAASDVYSLGATLYAVLTGEPPFTGKTQKEVLEQHLRAPVPDVRIKVPDCPQSLVNLISRTMSKEPSERPNALAFAMALRSEVVGAPAGVDLAMSANHPLSSGQFALGNTMSMPMGPGGSSAHVSGMSGSQSMQPPMRGRPWLIPVIVATFFGVLAVGGGAFFIMGPGSATPATNTNDPKQRQAISIRSEALVRFDSIAKIDPGQGFARALDDAKITSSKAQSLFDLGDYDGAITQYRALIERVDNITKRDAERQNALRARGNAEATIAKAVDNGADKFASDELKRARDTFTRANEMFEKAEFGQSVGEYSRALADANIAADRASEMTTLDQLSKEWESALNADAAMVEKVKGRGNKWRDIQGALQPTKLPQTSVADKINAYRTAVRLFDEARAEIQRVEEAAAADRRRENEKRISDLLAAADQAIANKRPRDAMARVEEALRLDSSNRRAQDMRTKLVDLVRTAPGTIVTNSLGMKFAYVPAGEFQMGSPSNEPQRDPDERQRPVQITKGFYMGITEVTQGQYRAIMNDAPSKWRGEDLPVEQVNFPAVQLFIRRLNERDPQRTYRLPTEAEWEYAARAGTESPYFTGDKLVNTQANVDGTKPVPVGEYAPNAWGLYDMAGNVYEWVSDLYGAYPPGRAVDPQGATPQPGQAPELQQRVIRGGSWWHTPDHARSANRFQHSPAQGAEYIGFRVVMEDPDAK